MNKTETGIGIVSAVVPMLWPHAPHWAEFIGLGIGLLLIGHGTWDFLKGKLKPSIEDERIPLLALRDQAKKSGWSFNVDSTHILDFTDALKQGAIDHKLHFWGRRSDHEFESLIRREPLVEIEDVHWNRFVIEPMSLMNATDNFDTITYIMARPEKGYKDLHVLKDESFRWLENEAIKERDRDPKKYC